MTYKELYAKTIAVNARQTVTLSTCYEYLFLGLSFLVTPIFLLFNVSANTVSVISLAVGLLSAGLIVSGGAICFLSGIILFFFFQVLDAVDGNVARVTCQSTHFGRFIDGAIGIVVLCANILSLTYLAYFQTRNSYLLWVGIMTTVIALIHHFYYDRYSALVRWMNEESNTHIQPYIKRHLSPRINWFLNDLHYTCIVALGITYIYRVSVWSYILLLYFFIHIGVGIYYIYAHTKSAYIYMRVPAGHKIQSKN